MFAAHLQAAIAAACYFSQVDDIVRTTNQALGSNALSDQEAQTIFELAHKRRQDIRGPKSSGIGTATAANGLQLPIPRGKPGGLPSYFPAKRRTIREKSAESWYRKNRLGMSSPLPFYLERDFTVGQLSVLRIIADEVFEHGRCDRSVAEIAARAGVSLTWAKQAIRLARQFNLLKLEARPQWRAKHKPNIVTVVSEDWLTWIKRAPRRKAQWAHQTTRQEEIQYRLAARALLSRAGASSAAQSGNVLVLPSNDLQIQKLTESGTASLFGIGDSFVTATEKQVILTSNNSAQSHNKIGRPLPFAARRPLPGPIDALIEGIKPQRGRS